MNKTSMTKAAATWFSTMQLNSLIFLSATLPPSVTLAAANAAQPVSYYERIKPVLAVHFLKCHAEEEKGGLRLDSSERAKKGGESGEPGIAPGQSGRRAITTGPFSRRANRKAWQ